jgi:hypothetical protein
MGNPSAVRFSRDGDQFHYSWAARRCLRLLRRMSDLVAISVEGASTLESAQGEDTREQEFIAPDDDLRGIIAIGKGPA